MEAIKKLKNEDKGHRIPELKCSKRIIKGRNRALRSKEICLERIRAYKQALIQYEHEPTIIVRARMLEEYLRSKTVFILEDELIVGNVTSKIRGSTIAPEMISFIDAELDDPIKDFEARPFEKFVISPEQRKELREDIIPFFKGKTLADFILPRIDEEVKEKACGLTASDPHNPVIGDFNLFKDLFLAISNPAYALTASEITKLLAFDGDDSDYFGISISIDNATIALEATRRDDNGVDTGSVYIFDKDVSENCLQIAKPNTSEGLAKSTKVFVSQGLTWQVAGLV